MELGHGAVVRADDGRGAVQRLLNAKEVRICDLEREQNRRTLTSSVRCLFAGDAPFKAVSKFEFEACGFSMFASGERERARRRLFGIIAAGPAS
jgi:hypothetical protein